MSVTFDFPNRIIIENDVGGDNVIDVVQVYSLWKNAVRAGDSLKYPRALRYVGSDPISPTQNLGATFFLTNGWKIRPAERNHKLTILGNIFSEAVDGSGSSGDSVFTNTLGNFTVNTETRVSNLVDSSVSRLDLTQLLPAVFIDVVRGVPGTQEGVGTPTKPVNNVSDAFVIAQRDMLREFRFRGRLALDRDAQEWTFIGLSSEKADVLDLSGRDVHHSKFSSITLTGLMIGSIDCEQCRLDIVLGLDGVFRRCSLASSFSLGERADVVLDSCYSEVPGSGTPVCTFSTDCSVNIRNYSGGIRLSNMTTGCVASVDADPGRAIIDPSCTGGEVLVRGVGRLTNLSNSPDLTIHDDGLLEPWRVKEVHRVHGLEQGIPLVVTPTARDAGGSLHQSITESGTTVTVERT